MTIVILRSVSDVRICRPGMHGASLVGAVEVDRRGALTGAVVGAGVDADAKDAAELLGAERGEGLEGDGEVGADLEAGVEDGGRTVHVGLGGLPGLHVGDVLVADAGDVHRLLEGLAEVEGGEVVLQGLAAGEDGGERLGVNGFRLAVLRDGPAEVLVRQDDGAVDEVAEHGDELGVVALLEVLPGEVVVLGFGGIGGEHVAEHVLVAGEVLLVLVHPDGPAAGGRELVALEVEELVGRDVVREDVIAVGLEHGREHDAVEDDVVLADEVDEAGVLVLPPGLPAVGEKFLRVGDVADRSVEPDVEHLAVGAFDGHRDAPVQVARDGTGLQAAVEPALALAVDVGLPLLVLLEDPLAEPGLVAVEREIPVLGFLLDRHGAAELGVRVQQFLGAEGRTAFLALVAVGVLVAALRAGALDEAVGEEHAGLGIVELLGDLRDEVFLLVELAEELRSVLRVDGGGGAGVDVEVDAELREGVLHDPVVAVHDVLRGDALLAGLDGDGDAVLVAAADEHHVLAAHAEIADVDVAGDVGAGEVADMDGAVRVGKGTGDQGSFAHTIIMYRYSFLSLPSFPSSIFRMEPTRSMAWRIRSCSSAVAAVVRDALRAAPSFCMRRSW